MGASLKCSGAFDPLGKRVVDLLGCAFGWLKVGVFASA